MNVIAGYKPPTDGKVFIGGCNISERPLEAKKMLGYLPEIPLFILNSSCIIFKVRMRIKGRQERKRESHIHEIMELVKITDVKDRLIKNLSKGYRQRVGLAQALVSNLMCLFLMNLQRGLIQNKYKKSVH